MKNLIRKNLLSVVALMSSIVAVAQTNPKAGYIITNQDDTIHGTIDYLTEKKSEHNCKFCKLGENKYVDYSPNEIKAYRAENDEFYYVAKTINVDNKSVRLFAEYLVKGGMSLYHFLSSGKDIYLIEGENGETAQISDVSVANSMPPAPQAVIRQNAAELSRVFKSHPQEMKKVTPSSFNANDLTDIVTVYNKTYCRDLGDCVQYSSNNNDVKRSINLKFLVGTSVCYEEYSLSNNEKSHSIGGDKIVASVLVGMNIDFPRFSKSLFAQTKAKLSYKNYSFFDKYYIDDPVEKEEIVNCYQLDILLGLGYRLLDSSTHKIVPFVHAGLDVNMWLSKIMISRIALRSSEKSYALSPNTGLSSLHGEGIYAGAGVFLPLTRKNKVEISLDYHYINSSSILLKSNIVSLTASSTF